MMKLRLFLFGLILLICNPVNAGNLSIKPFIKGSFTEIKNQHTNQPFIVVFWSESCSYCMKELAMFGKLYKQFPNVELITVATDSFLDEKTVKDVLRRSQLDVEKTWVFAEQFPERIYADVNKRWRGELPVTHFFSRDHQEIRHMGIINEQELLEWLSEQSSQ
ncbi:TlpA disulfide reductase family protein [Methylomarinum sp. Ch1-1]|uniref:TlpA disulfide reductase family protein n=1 Tax=Methylomarinum roseum TaxID=3067653 RepID=A0AAU7NRE0_9GAMM|nr:TlpA disulfide reductase family protein [Methylomarinum sp. Ch1-1]MDP4520467.1 TlpA disulfide reductase family protein [Methylomarinum sp. Ch1-1]